MPMRPFKDTIALLKKADLIVDEGHTRAEMARQLGIPKSGVYHLLTYYGPSLMWRWKAGRARRLGKSPVSAMTWIDELQREGAAKIEAATKR